MINLITMNNFIVIFIFTFYIINLIAIVNNIKITINSLIKMKGV